MMEGCPLAAPAVCFSLSVWQLKVAPLKNRMASAKERKASLARSLSWRESGRALARARFVSACGAEAVGAVARPRRSLPFSLSLILARPVNYSLQLNKVTEVLSVRPRRRPNERPKRPRGPASYSSHTSHPPARSLATRRRRRWEGHTSCLK